MDEEQKPVCKYCNREITGTPNWELIRVREGKTEKRDIAPFCNIKCYKSWKLASEG